jgi:hypothetical protein
MRDAYYERDKEKAKEWEREHGLEFYRSIYPHGIPKELLESFGIWIDPIEPKKTLRILK